MSEECNEILVPSSYTWKIEDLSEFRWRRVGESITSPIFKVNIENKEFKCNLLFYPMGINKDNNDFAAVFLECEETVKHQIGCIFYSAENGYHKYFRECQFIEKNQRCGVIDFLKRSKIMNQDKTSLFGTLTIFFEIIVDPKQLNDVRTKSLNFSESTDHLKSMVSKGIYSDVTFVVSGQSFPLHKIILAGQSEILRKIIDCHPEGKSMVVIYDALKPNVFQEVVHYMYTGRVEHLNDMAEELIAAANRFSLTDLKEMCVNNMLNKLSVDNADKYLKLADHYKIDRLKMEAIKLKTSS